MKDYPILFNDEMVRAVQAGLKTQTRRPVKRQPSSEIDGVYRRPDGRWAWKVARFTSGAPFKSPFGVPGDRLWVRECWGITAAENRGGFEIYDILRGSWSLIREDVATAFHYRATANFPGMLWRPNIRMPREACRTFLPVTDVRVERVQDISTADIAAEGIDNGKSNPAMGKRHDAMQRMAMQELWDAIYGTWDDNPWVWVGTFKTPKQQEQ